MNHEPKPTPSSPLGNAMLANVARYRSVQVTTSSKGDLLVMLYQALGRFLAEASQAMRAGDRARAGDRIGRAHAILDELASTLDASAAPELGERLMSLYLWGMGRLVEANLTQTPEWIDEVARVMTPIEEAFRTVVRGAREADTRR
jgi:flagellar protein FliS